MRRFLATDVRAGGQKQQTARGGQPPQPSMRRRVLTRATPAACSSHRRVLGMLLGFRLQAQMMTAARRKAWALRRATLAAHSSLGRVLGITNVLRRLARRRLAAVQTAPRVVDLLLLRMQSRRVRVVLLAPIPLLAMLLSRPFLSTPLCNHGFADRGVKPTPTGCLHIRFWRRCRFRGFWWLGARRLHADRLAQATLTSTVAQRGPRTLPCVLVPPGLFAAS